jgi:hypothetical protein
MNFVSLARIAARAAAAVLGGRAMAGPEVVARQGAAPAMNPAGAAAQPAAARRIGAAFAPSAPRGGQFVARVDMGGLRAAVGNAGAVMIEEFPLAPGLYVDLEVERFWVTAPGARFVSGGAKGDAESGFDPGEVVLLRGRVAGRERSQVYLGLSRWCSNGVIALGAGEPSYGVSSRGALGAPLPAGELSVFQSVAGRSPNPWPYCTVIEPPGGVTPRPIDLEPVRGLRQLELAVETDHEFWQLFGDTNAINAYLVEMYGAVSDIYMREVNIRVDLTYVRVWPQPDEPFSAGLNQFQSYWNANMGSVRRDVAQMYTGRADLPGGVAYLSSLCNDSAYGFCGNPLGYFADPVSSSVLNYDPMVAAHELGHNCGTHHTDVYAIDNCNLVAATPQRGTIMSYCNQTVSGGMANVELTFHKITQDRIREYTYAQPCVVFDCNQNGVSDAMDIAGSTSADVNTNGIPDECEDCNDNGVLDSVDISGATSLDLNANGIPDECEPDCNNNNVPDLMDITLGTSQDLHGDNVPDECDADRNTNNVSDYHEIMLSMPSDRDRDRILDATQDCDNDQVPDLVELDGAFDAWVIAGVENRLRRYHSVTGVLMEAGPASALNNAQDVLITPDARVLVSNAGTNSILEFDRHGQLVRTLVAAGAGGLNFPAGMLLSPTGTLLVVSRNANAVLEYDVQTGAFLRTVVATGAGGLNVPFSMLYSPTGTLLVSSGTSVLEYNGQSGAFMRILVAPGSGGLSAARGMALTSDGRLLVASLNTDQVLEYNVQTGAFIRPFLVTGLPIDAPWGVKIGPDGMVYVSRNNDLLDTHVTRARIFIHDPVTGNFVRAYVQALDSELNRPRGFDFLPGTGRDCNRNLIPDSCDITLGTSSDVNQNGIPDECEELCYANCDGSTTAPVLNVQDFTCFLQRYAAGEAYANCDGSTTAPVLNVQDFTCFLQQYAAGCP